MGEKTVTVSVDRLKPVHSDAEIVPMKPKHHSRPPRSSCATPSTTSAKSAKKKIQNCPEKSQTTVQPAVLGGGLCWPPLQTEKT